MTVPDEFGGGGASATDCAVVFEELGRGPLPGPYFSCGVLAAQLFLEGGQRGAAKRPGCRRFAMAAAIVIPALSDDPIQFGPAISADPRDRRMLKGFTLSGTKRYVQDGDAASQFICAARSDSGGVVLALVDRNAPGVSVKPVFGFMIGAAEVSFDNVAVGADALIGAVDSGWPVLEAALTKALPILCAYQVGACQEIFEMTNEYTRTRVVFGQPIGRFQRVQDHCVDISIHLDGARWITYETLWKIDSAIAATAGAHQSKAVASEAYYQSCHFAHMVFRRRRHGL